MPEPLARLDEIAKAANLGYGAGCCHDCDRQVAAYIATFSPELVKRLLAVVGIVNDHRSYCGAIDRLNTALSDLFAYLEDENEKEAWAAGEGPGLNPAEKP